jgi:transketolase
VVGYPSHPYAMKMNSEYFGALAATFEQRYGVQFQGIRDGAVKDPRERLVQFKTNMDVAMSVLDRDGLGDWLADRLVSIGDTLTDEPKLRITVDRDPFQDDRLRVANLPLEPQKVKVVNRYSGATKDVGVTLFRKAGEVAGTRRGISEIVKWVNVVTDNRFLTIAADLSESINLEHGNLWGHYDPETNPLGTRVKGRHPGGRQRVHRHRPGEPERLGRSQRSSPACGRSAGPTARSRRSCTRPRACGASRTRTAGSGWACCTSWSATRAPRPAADGRTHFGIFAPQVWKLFPRGQTIHLSFWDYNDVAPGYFAAAEIAAREQKVGIITLEVARPDFPVADRSSFADTDIRAAAKGFYLIRDFTPGKPRDGYVITQGSSSTVNLLGILPALEAAGVNVRVVAAISEELFDPPARGLPQRRAASGSPLRPDGGVHGTRRMWPLHDVGPLTDEYSLTSDWDDQWLTGGTRARRDRGSAPRCPVDPGRHHPLRS